MSSTAGGRADLRHQTNRLVDGRALARPAIGPILRYPGRRGALLATLLAGWGVATLRAQHRARSSSQSVPHTRHRHLPDDDRRHDGLDGTQQQLVFLDGGPAGGARVAVAWSADSHEVTDEQQRRHRYTDSGRIRQSPVGTPARVFVHAGDDPPRP